MGLFDTIHFNPPLQVTGWKAPVCETQTKHFGSGMQTYKVGSLLPESPVLIGVVEESLWLAPEEAGGSGQSHPLYLVIWHRILVGAYLDAGEAEARLRTVDRLDLIAWLDDAQRSTRQWQTRHGRLLADLTAWHKHLSRTENPTEEESTWDRLFFRLPEEILNAPDPLGAILETHQKQDSNTDSDEGDWSS